MNFDLQYDYAEALRHQKRTQSDVDATRKLVNVHEVVPKTITDKQVRKLLCSLLLQQNELIFALLFKLLLFLDSCGNPEEAARVTNIYYSMRKSNPEHFDNRNPLSSEIQQCLQHQEYFHLPNLPNGDHLIFHGVSNPKASDYIYDDAVKTYFMAIDSCLNKMGPRDGVVFLFDMKNVGLMHLTRASLKSIQKEMAYFQEGMPTKLREVHVLNATFFIDKVLMILKPFLKAGILKKVSDRTV